MYGKMGVLLIFPANLPANPLELLPEVTRLHFWVLLVA